MVDVAQLVRASVCGTEGRGFESRLPPHLRAHYFKSIQNCTGPSDHQGTDDCETGLLRYHLKSKLESHFLYYGKNSHNAG